MKRGTLFLILVVLVAIADHADAGFVFVNPSKGLGIAAGGAKGDNSSDDRWVSQYRGFLQYQIKSPMVLGQLSVGYTKLRATGAGAKGYTAETAMIDNRFLFIPFSMDKLNPFLYAGFGASKRIDKSGTKYYSMIPMGIGFQTMLGSQTVLEVSAGYNLSLSDELDGRTRSNSNLNNLTNQKHDGFFGFLIGLMFTGGSSATTDTDKNGSSNRVEASGTYSDNVDTYGDGLSDFDEVNRYHTDPLKADTDGDNLNDGTEVKKTKTDPLNMDTDNDGLNDGNELRSRANPLKRDTDNDGLNDGNEVNQHKTDPAKADTDGDGLSDGDEVYKYKTDPLKIDTDRGGVNDGAEVKRGTNPLDWKDDLSKGTTTIILEKGNKVILRGINFEFDKTTLMEDSRDILEVAYQALVANPDVQVEISGHTDSVGSDEYNQDLSLRRAQAVKNWLEQRGVRSERMITFGKGEREPIADNDTDEGRAENRRIEFYVQQ
jgi:outer membrane protein OmpA-like peptidoglycan-associated protein